MHAVCFERDRDCGWSYRISGWSLIIQIETPETNKPQHIIYDFSRITPVKVQVASNSGLRFALAKVVLILFRFFNVCMVISDLNATSTFRNSLMTPSLKHCPLKVHAWRGVRSVLLFISFRLSSNLCKFMLFRSADSNYNYSQTFCGWLSHHYDRVSIDHLLEINSVSIFSHSTPNGAHFFSNYYSFRAITSISIPITCTISHLVI